MNGTDITYSIVKTRQGTDTILVRSGGREVYIHSKVNPEREADLFTGRFDPARYDVLVVIGCGLGYHLLPLKETLDRYSDVIIIDVVPGLEREIGLNGLTSFLAGSPRVTILAGKSAAEVADVLSERVDMDRIRGIAVLEHPASVRAFGDYYGAVRKEVEKVIHIKAGNKATREAFGPRYVANILRNVRHLEGARPVRSLFGAFSGHPAVIAVSGPSLDGDIRLMKKARRRLFLVAVDSALPVLCRHGIMPDLVVSVDPQPYVREHFIRCDAGSVPVVCSISSHPSVLERRGVFLSLSTHPLAQLAAEVYGNAIGSVDSRTGSVAGDAISLCRACGFSAIGITGLDFSFSGYRIYARGTAYQDRYALFFQDRMTTVEGLNCRYILGGSGALRREGKFTRKSFLQYRQSIEDYIRSNDMDYAVLNERGLPPAGARHVDFNSFIGLYCREDISGKAMVAAIQEASKPIGAGPLADALGDIAHERLFDELLEASLGGRVSDRHKSKFRDMIDRGFRSTR